MKKALIIVLIVIIAASFIINNFDYLSKILKEDSLNLSAQQDGSITFRVQIPQNTPVEDTIWIYLHTQQKYKMDKISDFLYEKTIFIDKANLDNNKVKYRYSRNGNDFNTAEFLSDRPDTNDYFWAQKGRSIEFTTGKIQEDKVERWRWFPDENILVVRASDLEPETIFQPRIGNIEFRSGQIIEDLYIPSYDDFFESTAKHLKQQGYKWVEIDPPMQMVINSQGMPEIRNLIENNPNYPNTEKLKEEITFYKSQGLKVMLQPQLCCEFLDLQNKNQEFWDSYFKVVANFLVDYAIIAEQTGVEAMHYAIVYDYQGIDKNERYANLFREIRKNFSGEVGQMIWNFGAELGKTIPPPEEVPWADELDYIYVALDAPISLKNAPTDDELKAGASIVLDGTKKFYAKYNIPIFIRTTYFNVKQTWKGNLFYSISSIPQISESESELAESIYEFSSEDQARVINAYFKAISEKPFIIGYAQFGYAHWENPLSPELSIRGKHSEDLWRKWNNLIYSQ